MAKRFKKIYVEISNVCNLQCDFCPEVERPKKVMDETLFAKVIREIGPLTAEVCLHLMGDPLTHPKLSRYLEIASQEALPVNITTNGLLLDEVKSALLLSPNVRQVNFSLHSFKANFKGRDIRPYLDLVFHFTQRALRERPDLYLNYRLWNITSDEQASENEEIFSHIEDYFGLEINRRVHPGFNKSKRLTGRLYLHFDSRFEWPSLQAPIQGDEGFCHGLGSHIGIHADGTVVPCCLDKEAGVNLGNCREDFVERIVDSPRALAMREGFEKGRLVEDLCRRCTYIQRFGGKAGHS